MKNKIDSLVQKNKESLTEFEKSLGYRFTDLRLLQRALVHSSFAFERSQVGKDNEKLEFLGDAVLDLVIGHILMHRYPELKEGELTRLRASLVNEHYLAGMARKINLGKYLCLGKGEDASHGRNKSSILSCAYEAVIGAIFEDSDYKAAAGRIEYFFSPELDKKKDELLIADAKSQLQEVLQGKYGEGPSYRLESEEGPAHQKSFEIGVYYQDKFLGKGEGSSKKEAEQRAAAAALKRNLQNF